MPQILWQDGLIAWLILIGTILAILHTALHYGSASNAVQRKSLRIAMLLRMGVLVLLGISAFQPRVLLPAGFGHKVLSVHVLVDDSGSMSMVDQNRPAASLMRIGEMVGFIELSSVERPLRTIIERVNDLKHELAELRSVWGRLAESKTRGLIDAGLQSRSRELLANVRFRTDSLIETVRNDPSLKFIEPKLRQIREQLDSPRRDQPEKTIESLREDLVRQDMRIDEQMIQSDPSLRSRIEQLASQSRFDLARLAILSWFRESHSNSRMTLSTFRSEITSEELIKIRPDLGQTHLLKHLRQRMEKLQNNMADALICFTDGRMTEADRSIPMILSSTGIPIFFVLCAPRDIDPGIRTVSLDAPTTALPGEQIPIFVRITNDRLAGRSVKVRLTDGTKEWVQSVNLSDESDRIDFIVPVSGQGEVRFQAEVQIDSGDKVQARHSAETVVRIKPQKISILLLSGENSREIQYLREVLSETPWVMLEDQSPAPDGCFQISPSELLQHDLIVLAGVRLQSLSDEQRQAIFRHIVEHSKPILMMGLTPDILRQYAFDPLLNVCVPQFPEDRPVWQSSFRSNPGFQPIPSSAASQIDIFRTGDSFEDSLRQWLSQPALSRVIQISDLKPQAQVLLADRETGLPLLIESGAGSGRVLTFLVDETWRWRATDNTATAGSFWHATVRHLVEPDYTQNEDGLAVKIDKEKLVPGEAVRLQVRSTIDSTTAPIVQFKPKDQIGEQVKAIPVLPLSGRWVADWVPSQAGRYEVVVQQGKRKVTCPITVAVNPQMEYADTKPDLNLLHRIAALNGGQVFDLENLDEVKKAIWEKKTSHHFPVIYEIWCSPYWFGLMASCLGLEWAIRKRTGLA